ncbi:MAG: sigma-54-dependent Fis family transcriptional regulator [Acidobacteria bacterium]|nr:sigma-54-dependent Fis family transcriptional regulator [Acidobacteriota bacterium]
MASRPISILVVDDDPAMRMVLDARLRNWGYNVLTASDGAEAEKCVRTEDPDIILSDVVMPGLSGLDLLRSLKEGDSQRPVILITAEGTIDMAVEAMKQGAQDFITKPLDYSKLQAILDAAQLDLKALRESRKLSSQIEKGSGFGAFVGTSKRMRDVYDLLESLAASDASAIISGESGTGKELAARTIHERSARAQYPFIAINAAAIPETLIESELFGHEKGAFTGAVGVRAGCFELAHRGTLFLDEIAEMPTPLQPKLLRVLEDGKVRRLGGSHEFAFNVRVIAATNQDLKAAIQSGKLREDLFYRLNVFNVVLPTLRDRKEDIPAMAQHFIHDYNHKHGTSVIAIRPDALELLKTYSWPGNVRELRNVIERAVILARGEWIETSHLPPYLRVPEKQEAPEARIVLPLGLTAADSEKELILKTLEATGNNKAETARRLGLDVKTIRNKLKSYGMR